MVATPVIVDIALPEGGVATFQLHATCVRLVTCAQPPFRLGDRRVDLNEVLPHPPKIDLQPIGDEADETKLALLALLVKGEMVPLGTIVDVR